jgi:hypothetical protein
MLRGGSFLYSVCIKTLIVFIAFSLSTTPAYSVDKNKAKEAASPGKISDLLGIGKNCSAGCELVVSGITAGVAFAVGYGKLNSVSREVKEAKNFYQTAGNPFIAANLLQDPYNIYQPENIVYQMILRKNYKNSVNNYGSTLNAFASTEIAALIVAAWNGYDYWFGDNKEEGSNSAGILRPSLVVFPTLSSFNNQRISQNKNELNAEFSLTFRW